jgi:two-component system response regulator AlgR
MNILIVDDEPLARERLRRLLEAMPDMTVAGEAGNGREALQLCAALQPDVLLLDIRMPGMDGIETARHLLQLEHPPAVIFTTAYSAHALEAFDAQAVDYLLKPVQAARLAQALAKARRLSRAQADALQLAGQRARSHICVRLRGNLLLIPVEDIRLFQADMKYVTVHHAGGEALIEEALKALEEEMGERFVRTHRNALAARRHLAGLEQDKDGQWHVRFKNTSLRAEVSRRHLPAVRALFRGGHPET